LSLVSTNDGKQVILLKETACRWIGEEVRAAANMIVNEELLRLFLSEFFQRISPEDVAHETVGWWFSEAIDLQVLTENRFAEATTTYRLDIFESVQLGTQSTMDAEKLLVHDGSKRKSAE
jgi:hypothetical protein